MEPNQRMMELIVGSWAAQAVYAAVALGIPERLEPASVPLEQLAADTGCAAPALQRLMDYLVALEICTGTPSAGYGLTEFGAILRPDVPGSVNAYAYLAGKEFHPVWGEVLYSLRTGGPAFAHVHGQDLYSYLAADPAAGRRFDAAMNVGHVLFEHVAGAYSFNMVTDVVDVAGGNGELLAAILKAHPAPRGVLFEGPSATGNAREYLDGQGVGERCEVIAGDMLTSVPAGADVYLLSRVLVNWDDEQAQRILGNCAAAMKENSTLLIVERPQSQGRPTPLASAVDMLMMLVTTGGRSRTLQQFADLFTAAGLVPGSDHELPRGFRLLTARRA